MSHPRESEILDAWKAGDRSITDIARALHVSRSVVAGILKRARERGDVRAAYRKRKPKPRASYKPKPTKREYHMARVVEKIPPVAREQIPPTPRPKPPPRPVIIPQPEWADISFRDGGGLTILDLPFTGACKWPVGDPRQSSFRYCGAPAEPTCVYCERHAALARGTGTSFERAAVRDALARAA